MVVIFSAYETERQLLLDGARKALSKYSIGENLQTGIVAFVLSTTYSGYWLLLKSKCPVVGILWCGCVVFIQWIINYCFLLPKASVTVPLSLYLKIQILSC